jgi:uncharacterized protein
MEIPLFPLHAVLAPGIALPLHVFEPRYRAMVRHCLDTSTPFGIVLIRDGSEVLRDGDGEQEVSICAVGTLAEIREASRFSDGRWRLLVVGDRRFVVRQVYPDREAYLVADVDVLEDPIGNAAVARALVGRVTRRFVDYLRLLQPRDGEAVESIDVQVEVEVAERDVTAAAGGGPEALSAALEIPDDPSTLSFLLAGIVQVEPSRRQALLEAPTAERRLRNLDTLLDLELMLLARRLGPFTPDKANLAARRN